MTCNRIFLIIFFVFGSVLFASAQATVDTAKKVIKILSEEKSGELFKALREIRQEHANSTIGKSVAAFSVRDMDKNLVSSRALKGKIYVLNFWFVACKPCVMEMPELNELVSKYKDKNIEFIAFAIDSKDDVRAFLKKTAFNYRQIPDARFIIRNSFKISSYPTHIIVNKEGKVEDIIFGYSSTTVSSVDEGISKLLAE